MRGLVLAGGGAKGAYQIGAWKALRELGIEFDVVCGTSIGAFNGAFVAQHQFDKAYRLWSNMTMNDLFEADPKLINAFERIIKEKKFPTNLSLVKDFFYYIRKSGGVNISPLRKMIDKYLEEDLVRTSNIQYGLVTVSLDKMKPLRLFVEDIPDGELKHYLLGSAMVPGFARKKSDPFKFVDGGVVDNFPVKMAIDKGCNEVIAVSLGSIKRKTWENAKVIYIEPKEDLGNFLHVEKERIHKNIRMGYLDAFKAMGKLDGNKFYFRNFHSENECLQRLVALDFEVKNAINRLVFEKDLINERFFFEKTLYKIARMLKLDLNAGYMTLVLHMYEALLTDLDSEVYEVYSPVIANHRIKDIEFEGELEIYKLLLGL